MNKTEIITEVSQMTSVSVADCEKVLDALEEVLGGELNRKGWKNGLFDMIFQIMSKIKSKKRVIGIYFFLSMLSVNVWGQKEGRILTQSVRGRVIDAASGYPVAYASVYLMGSNGFPRPFCHQECPDRPARYTGFFRGIRTNYFPGDTGNFLERSLFDHSIERKH